VPLPAPGGPKKIKFKTILLTTNKKQKKTLKTLSKLFLQKFFLQTPCQRQMVQEIELLVRSVVFYFTSMSKTTCSFVGEKSRTFAL